MNRTNILLVKQSLIFVENQVDYTMNFMKRLQKINSSVVKIITLAIQIMGALMYTS